jgi:hypothetical protein
MTVQAAHRLREVDVEAALRLGRQARQPDGEQQQPREHREDDCTDQHVIGAGFHQASTCSL